MVKAFGVPSGHEGQAGLVDEIYVFTGFASLQRAGEDSGLL